MIIEIDFFSFVIGILYTSLWLLIGYIIGRDSNKNIKE